MSSAVATTDLDDVSGLWPVGLVDADVHPLPQAPEELRGYLPEPWRSRSPEGFVESAIYLPWGGGARVDARPDQGPPGSDPRLLEQQLLNEAGVDIAMLLPIVRSYNNPQLEAAMSTATNEWVADTWLGPYNWHGRYRASINVCPDLPETAVAEIERWAEHPYFAQVRFNSYTDSSFGNQRYDPVYAAAAKYRLPVSVHFAKSSGARLATPAGFPSSYFETHSLVSLQYAAQLTSLVIEGAFARHPDLMFVFVEGGFSWIAPLLWRMDNAWSALRMETPWLIDKPSSYVRRGVRFTTQPIEEPGDLADLYRTYEIAGADNLLMFSTDYPHWDFNNPSQAAFNRMPVAMRHSIFAATAIEVYDLPAVRDARPVGFSPEEAESARTRYVAPDASPFEGAD